MNRRRLSTLVTATAALTLVAGAAGAQPPSTTTPPPFTTPNTDSCPFKDSPMRPIDASEVPKPGDAAPAPLPVPTKPVGGAALGSCSVVTPAGAAPLPADISAHGWVVSDLDTGAVLAAKDPHGRYRPASTIKVLLATLALGALDLTKTVPGTADDMAVDGTRVGIGPGGVYTNRQLMQALVMASGNDAANVIARELGGVEETLRKMNELARSLGGLDTRAASPSGLDGPGMSISAYDLALFFRTAMRIPMFAELVHTEEVPFPGTQPNTGWPIANDNQLLFNYPGALGGKTGFTDDARHTFVGGAQRDGRRLAVTLMQAEVRPIRPWEQAARLLDYGFALAKAGAKPVGTLVEPGTVSEKTGIMKDAVGDDAVVASPPTHDPTRSPVISDRAAAVGATAGIAALLLAVAFRRRWRRR